MAAKKRPTDAILRELRELGLTYPGAHLKSPWPGHLDLAVRDKTFAYLSVEGDPLSISCKLPHSNAIALMLPNTEPTGYGLGKSGWVTAKFPDEPPPIDLLRSWIDESYRAQAPKKLIAAIGAGGAPTAAGTASAAPKKTPPKKKTAAEKAAAPRRKTAAPSRKTAAPRKKAAARR